MLTRRRLGGAGGAVGERAAVVGEEGHDLHRRSPLEAAQEVGAALVGLGMPWSSISGCKASRSDTPCRRRQPSRPERETSASMNFRITAGRSSTGNSRVRCSSTASSSCTGLSVVAAPVGSIGVAKAAFRATRVVGMAAASGQKTRSAQAYRTLCIGGRVDRGGVVVELAAVGNRATQPYHACNGSPLQTSVRGDLKLNQTSRPGVPLAITRAIPSWSGWPKMVPFVLTRV